MRGLKASIVLVILTAAICLAMVGGSMCKKIYTSSGNSLPEIEEAEGSFPGDICYISGDGSGIFYVKYDKMDTVYLYDTGTQSSSAYLNTVQADKKIGAFCSIGGYVVWEEEDSPESDEGNLERDFKIYLRKSGKTIKVDEGKGKETPSNLSIYGNSLVYRTYGKVPGTLEGGVLIKLYDLGSEKGKVIFSLGGEDNVMVSEPYVYKDYVVWSVCSIEDGDTGNINSGDIYLYSKKTGMYQKISQGEKLTDPMVWQDYIVCTKKADKNNSLVIFNINDGTLKEIAVSDMSSFPPREVYDYTVGDGYVAWNNSYLDSVSVYDILDGKKYELKKSITDKDKNNSLLNVKIFGKTLFYRDHVYNRSSSKTLSEINRYIILK